MPYYVLPVPSIQRQIPNQSGLVEMTNVSNVALCPSARADGENARVFGIVTGTVDDPRVRYLRQAQPSVESTSKLQGKVAPEEVFRVAATCEEKGCQHFDGQDCRLAIRIVDQLPVVTAQLPPCAIRRDCRWWQQEGKAACVCCPQVVTDHYNLSELMVHVAIA